MGRLWDYIRGRQMEAEGLADAPDIGDFTWIEHARSSRELAAYALEAARRSAEAAQAAIASLQTRAGSLLSMLLTLIPVSIVVTGLALSSTAGPRWSRFVAFALMTSVDIALVLSAMLAFIASGMLISGGLNLDRMARGEKPSIDELQAGEANAWHLAAQLSMWQGPRIARDLFHARRLAIVALLLAIVASPFVVIARSGDQVITGKVPASPSPSPSGSPHT